MSDRFNEKVLVVEDERHARQGLVELAASWGYRSEGAADGLEGLTRIESWSPSIVVLDLKMPRMDGMEMLRRLEERSRVPPCVIVLTAQGTIESAVEAMRLGAWDYLPKPVDPPRLRAVLASASRQRAAAALEPAAEEPPPSAPDTARTGASAKPGKPAAVPGVGDLVGSSPAMQAVFRLIERVASANVSVLVTGESGTGKELVARALHLRSSRRTKPFVAVNCAAIPETLIESEIFGHERGAFTGALDRRAGCFELAEEGTLLLDEIGEMPAGTQAKLLRVLEDRTLRRLGSKVEQPVDVRVVAATNKEPLAAIAAGELRADLFYRLNVFNIAMPPLREHPGDIPTIAAKLIADLNAKHGCTVPGVSAELLERFTQYRWPGNVRELRNTLERAVVMANDRRLEPDDLPPGFGRAEALPATAAARSTFPGAATVESSAGAIEVEVGTSVNEAERKLIVKTLSSTGGNKTRAAEMLGISTKTLGNKLKEYAGARA